MILKGIDPKIGFTKEDGEEIVRKLELGELSNEAIEEMIKLYNVFVKLDATLVEINPWAICSNGIKCIDAKFNIDDNALFR